MKYLVFITILCMLTLVISIINKSIDDPFNYSNIVLAKIIKENGSISNVAFNLDGYWQRDADRRTDKLTMPIIILSIEYITNIDPLELSTMFHIGNIILPIFIYMFAYKFSHNALISFIISVYTIFSLPHTSIGHTTVGFIFHIMILILFLKLITNRSLNKGIFIIIILISIALHMTYYTTEFLTITFIMSLALLYLIKRCDLSHISNNYISRRNIIHISYSLVIIYLIIFIGFERIIIHYFSDRYPSLSRIQQFFFNYVKAFSDTEGNNASLVYRNSLIPITILSKTLIFLFVSMVIVLSVVIRKIKNLYSDNQIIFNISLGLIIVALSEILLYSSIGAPAYRYLNFIVPVAVFYFLYRNILTGRTFVKIMCLSCIFYLLGSSIYIYVYRNIYDDYYIYYNSNKYTDMYNNMARWLFTSTINTRVDTTLQLSALLFGVSTYYNLYDKVKIEPFGSNISLLLQPTELCNSLLLKDRILIIPTTVTNKPLFGELWQERREGKIINVLSPTDNVLFIENNNSCINRVFNDNNTLIYINNNRIIN